MKDKKYKKGENYERKNEEYPDLEIECRVIPNDKIGEYLDSIPEDKKFYAYKTGKVEADPGFEGQEVKTVLKTIVDGKEYILSEEDNVVRRRKVSPGEVYFNDIVVKNISSASQEQYVVKYEKFDYTYNFEEVYKDESGTHFVYTPVYDSRLLTQVDENVIIMTSWGAPAVCLAGSYIVTYNAEENDYNTLEQGAFESTYTVENQKTKKLNS